MLTGRLAPLWLAICVALTGCIVTGPYNFIDEDGDGYPVEDDCDDTDASVEARFHDRDGDGFGDTVGASACDAPPDVDTVDRPGDCDDDDDEINPDEPEICNGVDDNCRAGVDEGLVDCDPDADEA